MQSTSPVCHATLARGDSGRPWELQITVGFVPVDGLTRTESFSVSTADLLVHHLSVLGINTLRIVDAADRAATPADIMAAVQAGSDLSSLSLIAEGVSGSEMAWRLSALRELEN